MKHIISQRVPFRGGPYSHATQCGDMLFLSGQRPVDAHTGVLVSDLFAEQAHQVFQNIKEVLDECDSSLDHVAKVNIYLADIAMFAEMNEIYMEYFNDPYPARTTIACSLRGVLVEVDVIATTRNS